MTVAVRVSTTTDVEQNGVARTLIPYLQRRVPNFRLNWEVKRINWSKGQPITITNHRNEKITGITHVVVSTFFVYNAASRRSAYYSTAHSDARADQEDFIQPGTPAESRKFLTLVLAPQNSF